MSTVLRPIDLSPIQAAIEADDARTVERIAGELGIELSYATLIYYLHRFERQYAAGLGRAAFALFYAALHDPAGYAVESGFGLTLLAVRRGATLVFGVQKKTDKRELFPPGGWKIGRWFKEPARNRTTVDAWAADLARTSDALRIPITRAAAQAGAIDNRGDALLAAVTADPDDDAARLVYADWLSEQGDARGELIRVQCELAIVQPADRRDALRERQHQLLSSVVPAMKAEVDHFTEGFEIARGLIESVTLFVVKLAKFGPELVVKHPIKRLRILCNGEKEFARLANLPFLARIPELEIESRKTPRVLMSRAVMRPSTQPRLFSTTRRLELADLDDPADEWRAWLSAVEAPVVEELRLTRASLDLAGYQLLAEPYVFPALRCLEVAYPPFATSYLAADSRSGNQLVAAVSAIAQHRSLDEYRFTSWHIEEHVLGRCVAEMLQCSTLTRLVIDNCTMLGPTTIDAVIAHGGRLRHLQLDDLDGAVLGRVVRALHLDSLSCDVPGNHEAAIDAIASSSIKRLWWRSTRRLTDAERTRLAHLDLRYTRAT